MSIIRLDDVAFRRGDRQVLSGVSWAVGSGENWAMLGPNGSGKTTLLKIITGYEWVSDGEVQVLGQTFGQCDVPALRKTIGWVSSAIEHRLPEYNTAEQVVLSGLEASIGLYREFTTAERAAARNIMELLGCPETADQRYETLSQGERQRVLISRALVSRPALLILDEPCSGLDPVARELFLDDLERLTAQAGAPALVLVTHHIEEIGPWITHVLALRAGEVVAAGRKPEILTPQTLERAFGRRCTLTQADGRYSVHWRAAAGVQ
jgi:iron complex transport system ATP-binding protein